MNSNKDCEIVQDLLLGYVDDVLNPESKKMVENHLKECKECIEKLDLIKKDIKENEDQSNNEKKIDYLKKIRMKGKIKSFIIFIIFLTIFFTVIFHTIKNVWIFKQIDRLQEKYVNSTNYHIVTYNFTGSQYVLIENYRKGDKYLGFLTRLNQNGLIKLTNYSSGQDNRTYVDAYTNNDSSKKVYYTDSGIGNVTTLEQLGIGKIYDNLLRDAFLSRISSGVCNGKECYIIESKYLPSALYDASDNSKVYIYIDKSTGLRVRDNGVTVANESPEEKDKITDFVYEFDTVTDDDFTLPNIDEYEIVDSNN